MMYYTRHNSGAYTLLKQINSDMNFSKQKQSGIKILVPKKFKSVLEFQQFSKNIMTWLEDDFKNPTKVAPQMMLYFKPICDNKYKIKYSYLPKLKTLEYSYFDRNEIPRYLLSKFVLWYEHKICKKLVFTIPKSDQYSVTLVWHYVNGQTHYSDHILISFRDYYNLVNILPLSKRDKFIHLNSAEKYQIEHNTESDSSNIDYLGMPMDML